MAIDTYKCSMQDVNGNYYSAVKLNNATWSVTTGSELAYLSALPEGWNKVGITWERDPHYKGIFRASTDDNFTFYADGRAIIQSVRNSKGLAGTIIFTIYQLQGYSYNIFYQCQIDFESLSDNMQIRAMECTLLETGLKRDLNAFADTEYNTPCFLNGGTDRAPVWFADPDLEWVIHDGIKLRWQQLWTSAATALKPIYYVLNGYCGGQFGTLTHQGCHSLPEMNPFNLVANNGATTFIGNDIMQQTILAQFQQPGANIIDLPTAFSSGIITNINETVFSGANASQPYTRANNILTNNLKSVDGTPMPFVCGASISVTFVVPDSSLPVASTLQRYLDTAFFSHGVGNNTVSFVLFEVGPNSPQPNFPSSFGNNFCDAVPVITSGGNTGFDYIPIMQLTNPGYTAGIYTGLGTLMYLPPLATSAIELPDYTYVGPGTYYLKNPPNVPVLSSGVCYVLGIIYDNDIFLNGNISCNVPDVPNMILPISDLTLTFASIFNGGASAPIAAPLLPATVFPAFTPGAMLKKIVPYFATKNTNRYGFPIQVGRPPYEGFSTFLNDPSVIVGDMCPAQIKLTSDYMIHDLQGQSYITLSFSDLFDFAFKVCGCGAGIEIDTFTGLPTILRIENLGYFYDNTTCILDLGDNISNFKITPLTENMGCNLKLGYTQEDLNSDFGTTSAMTELFFNIPPLAIIPGIMDFEHDAINVNEYVIEKARAQQTSQPIGMAYNPANPSTTNNCHALYCRPAVSVSLPTAAYGALQPYDPANNALSVNAFQLQTYPNAQNLDPIAGTAPYMTGWDYPDTVINAPLTPCRLYFNDAGRYLHSVLDKMDADYLVFRNTFVMQFNNDVSAALPNFASNIGPAGLVQEMTDKLIGSLPGQLFKPNIFTFTTEYPVNLYQLLNANARGYVKLIIHGEGYNQNLEFHGFVIKAKQIADSSASEFILIGTPDIYGTERN